MPVVIIRLMPPPSEWIDVEVLVQGQWYPGQLERWHHDERGWRGLVRYSTAPGMTYVNWQSAEVIRKRP